MPVQHRRVLAALSAAGATAVLITGGSAVAAAEPSVAFPQAAQECDPNYSGCVPVSDVDLDCDDVGGPVDVLMVDIHGLDADGDDRACEGDEGGGGDAGVGGADGGGTDDGAADDDGGLAETGSSSAGLVGVAGLTLLGGVFALRVARRRTA